MNSSAANLKLFNISVIISQPEAAVARLWKQSVSSQTTTLPANQYRQSSCLTFRTASKLQKNQTSPTKSHQSQNAVKAADDFNQKHENPNLSHKTRTARSQGSDGDVLLNKTRLMSRPVEPDVNRKKSLPVVFLFFLQLCSAAPANTHTHTHQTHAHTDTHTGKQSTLNSTAAVTSPCMDTVTEMSICMWCEANF